MAAKTQGYQVGDQVVTNLTEVAGLLGVGKITSKDVAEGGKYADQVQLIDLEEAGSDPGTSDNGGDTGTDEYYSALGDEEIQATPQELEEALPDFETLDELKEFIKDIDTPTLEYFAKGLKLDWTPTHHAAIHRMRVAQSMHRHFFPEQFKPKGDKKKKGKFGDLSTDQLFDMVKENKLNVKKSGNEPIDRMRAIMALKTVGVLAE